MTKETEYTPLDRAKECGSKAAIAQNQHDAARVTHWRDYFRRWIAYQPEGERITLRKAYDEAYTESRVIR